MPTWLIAADSWLRAIVGAVFLLAGGSKLYDSRRFAAALEALGVGRGGLRKSLKIGVPLAEVGLGVWLWTGLQPLLSATTACVVVVVLTGILSSLRWRGYTGSCGCFLGENGPIGSWQVVRNAILFVLCLWTALIAAVARSPSGQASSSWMPPVLLLTMTTVLTLGAVALYNRRELFVASGATGSVGFPSTQVVPRMEWTDLAGERVVVGRTEAAAQLVVFAKGRCPGCLRDRDLLNRLAERLSGCETVIVCGGDLEETKELAREVRPPVRIVADPGWRTAVAWQVAATPFTVLVDSRGWVRGRGQLTATLPLLSRRIEFGPRLEAEEEAAS